jgi:hypothetical protein
MDWLEVAAVTEGAVQLGATTVTVGLVPAMLLEKVYEPGVAGAVASLYWSVKVSPFLQSWLTVMTLPLTVTRLADVQVPLATVTCPAPAVDRGAVHKFGTVRVSELPLPALFAVNVHTKVFNDPGATDVLLGVTLKALAAAT